MKDLNRILAMLVAVLLLLGAMSAFAEVEVELDASQDIDGLDLDIDVPELDISKDAFELSDDLSLVEEAPEAAVTVSNDDGETPTEFSDSFTLEVGQYKRIHHHPRKYYTINITDTSSDPNVARVGSGMITAVTAGKCIITVTTTRRWGDPDPRVYRYEVTVYGGPVLSEKEKALHVNETFQLNVSNLGKRSIRSWSSSDPNVATVDNGMVTAVGEGQCDISVEISNGGFLKCRVEVQGDTGLSSNHVTLSVDKQSTLMLKDRYLRKISWSCSDPNIVKIMTEGSFCLMRALRKGECTITARLKSGKTLSCKVTVQ